MDNIYKTNKKIHNILSSLAVYILLDSPENWRKKYDNIRIDLNFRLDIIQVAIFNVKLKDKEIRETLQRALKRSPQPKYDLLTQAGAPTTDF